MCQCLCASFLHKINSNAFSLVALIIRACEKNIDTDILLSSSVRRRWLLNSSVDHRWESDGSLSPRDIRDCVILLAHAPYGRRIFTVVSRLTTRRNVYDVFNRRPRAYTRSRRSAGRPSVRLSVVSRPVRGIAHFAHNHRANLFQRHIFCPPGVVCSRPLLTSFITGPCCSFAPDVLLNYRPGPTVRREWRYRGRIMSVAAAAAS